MPAAPRWAYAVEDGLEAWGRCALVEELCCQVRELWEAVTRVHSIGDDEKEINRTFSETPQVQEPNFPTALKEGQAEFLPIRFGSGDSQRWLNLAAISGTRGKAPVPHEGLQLQDRLGALATRQRAGTSV